MENDAARPHLILWDIDHTLIETRGLGFAIYQRAFPAATGRPLEQLAQVSGRTVHIRKAELFPFTTRSDAQR